jgi:hypothetical protein
VFGHGWIRRAGDAGCFVGSVVEFSPFASVISIGTRESSGKIANDIGDRTLSAWTWYGTLPIAGVIRTWPVGNVLYLRSVDPKHRQELPYLRWGIGNFSQKLKFSNFRNLQACTSHTSVHLTGVYLIDIYLIGMHLIGVYLTGMYLMSVYLISVIS